MYKQIPNGNDLLNVLVKLLAEQEGVRITYKLEEIHNAQ